MRCRNTPDSCGQVFTGCKKFAKVRGNSWTILLVPHIISCYPETMTEPVELELVIMAGTVLLAYYFECTDTFQVHIQGFFCQDGNLMKPYPGTEDESFISPLVLYCVLASTPTAIIFIGEISMYFIKSTRETLIIQEKTILTGECCYLNPLLRRIIRFIGVFAFGLFATDIFVNAGQVVTGNLAPYFLTVCKPNYTGNDCRAHHEFINNGNICTGDVAVIEKARRSFPSKHAALSIYSALYATMYITSTIKTKSSRLAKPVLCLGTLCAAFLTGLNRVSEYRNHCSDVIAGFILGSAVALFLGICVVHNFKGTHGAPSKPKPEDPRGMPLMAFPRVESPLETLSAQCSMVRGISLNFEISKRAPLSSLDMVCKDAKTQERLQTQGCACLFADA
ncbi:hypothetical protein Q9233_017591 [Columba guinea]|nr:hypothetical protein Q9233_017591 [Columba guinea]